MSVTQPPKSPAPRRTSRVGGDLLPNNVFIAAKLGFLYIIVRFFVSGWKKSPSLSIAGVKDGSCVVDALTDLFEMAGRAVRDISRL